MVDTIGDIFRDLDFNEYHRILIDGKYYEILFPFLLVYALLFAALSNVKIFRDREGFVNTSIVALISLIVSYFSVSFEIREGYTVGKLMMLMFPNISAITMGALTLYIVGAIFGKNIFKDLFRKDFSAFVYIGVGIVGLGAVTFYVGIAFGFWDFDPFNMSAYWNTVIAVALLILGIVLLFSNFYPVGIVFSYVFIAYFFGDREGNILQLFIDPFVFMIFIFLAIIAWMDSGREKALRLTKLITKGEANTGIYKEGEDSKIKDILDEILKGDRKEFKKLTGKDLK